MTTPPPILTTSELIEYVGATGRNVVAQATAAIAEAEAYVEGYTRGNHRTPAGSPRAGIKWVVLSVAGRILANPGKVSTKEQIGAFSFYVGDGFNGFNLAELAILNRYRKRAIG